MPANIRDHYLPPDPEAFRRAEPPTGRLIVIAPTRAACETIELALALEIDTVLEQEHGQEIRDLARRRMGFGIVAGTGTGKTLAIRPIAQQIVGSELRVGVVNREREATPDTSSWNVVIVTTGIARRWFQDDLVDPHDTVVIDEIHQTSAELELCLALGKRVGCRFIWLSATVDPTFYAEYLDSADVLETSAFNPRLAAKVTTRANTPVEFLNERFIRKIIKERRGVALFLPTRAEVEKAAAELGGRWPRLNTAFYHGGEPIRIIRPFLQGDPVKPFLLAMTQAGQSALNIQGLDTVVIYDAVYNVIIDQGRNVLTRQHLGPNEILQMAGRVHGRVPNGEVYLLTDRSIDFERLEPTAPDFQLAGDNERIALTAAALSVDLRELVLPVPLDRRAYARAVNRLTARGLISSGRLTPYGRDVEALPVDRPWAELLVQAPKELIPLLAVMANINSLHHMTRDRYDIRDLTVWGSDHLTGYRMYREALHRHGYVGSVYGLPRHLFREEIDAWAENRGVLMKVLEDVALGASSVYRALEWALPDQLPRATSSLVSQYQDLVARVMPFDLVMEGALADGQRVRLSRSSVCDPDVPVAGRVSYFADKFGVARGAIEGTNVPYKLVQRYATRSEPSVEYAHGRRPGLQVTIRTSYFGFELTRERRALKGDFPDELADKARDALVQALFSGATPHPDQQRLYQGLGRVREYWRRSGGTVKRANPEAVRSLIERQLDRVSSWQAFLETPLSIDVDELVPAARQSELDELPASAKILGDRVPLSYEFDRGDSVVRIRLREGQARRLRARDLPEVDRPLRFSVVRGKRELVNASSLEELSASLLDLPGRPPRQPRRPHRGRRRGRH